MTLPLVPSWMAGQPLNAWIAIPGTAAAGSAADPAGSPANQWSDSNLRLAYSGLALRGTELVLAAVGGHSDYSGNEVTSIDISLNAPVWQLRHAKSATATMDVPYYSDGMPTSRHVYWSSQWNSARNRVMLHNTTFSYGNAVSFPASNGFNLDTNKWDAAGTWSDGYEALCQDSSGNCWASSGYFTLMKWTAATDTWAATATFNNPVYPNLSFDSLRNQLFQLSWGDGEGSGAGVTAFTYDVSGTIQTAISFNASAAYTQFVADAPLLAAMDYDRVNDKFYFYASTSGATDRIYTITPNAGTVWDMAIVTVTGVIPPLASGAGIMNRLCYVAPLTGFVCMPDGISDIIFIRTA